MAYIKMMKGIKVQKACQCTLANMTKCHILADWIGLNICTVIIRDENSINSFSTNCASELSPAQTKGKALTDCHKRRDQKLSRDMLTSSCNLDYNLPLLMLLIYSSAAALWDIWPCPTQTVSGS